MYCILFIPFRFEENPRKLVYVIRIVVSIVKKIVGRRRKIQGIYLEPIYVRSSKLEEKMSHSKEIFDRKNRHCLAII